MKLVILGSGSAFTTQKDNFQSNFILENDEGKKLLIDCGSDARWSLDKLGLSYRDIDSIFITHLHADHTGGLEWLAFSTYFDPSCKKPTLYITSDLVDDLWNKVLVGGLSSLKIEIAELSTYFNVVTIPNNSFFAWSGIDLYPTKAIHAFSGNCILPCYGLFFLIRGINILITGDCQFIPHLFKDLYKRADIIFQDCETSPNPSGVHAHYNDLMILDDETKKKMWLYQYNPGPLPDAEKDGFKGFVSRGQIFDFT